MSKERDILDQLMQVIHSRRQQLLTHADDAAEASYVKQLLSDGLPALKSKLAEECRELQEALEGGQKKPIIHEGADLFFHMMVAFAHAQVSLDDIRQELKRRLGTSGIEEKANRSR